MTNPARHRASELRSAEWRAAGAALGALADVNVLLLASADRASLATVALGVASAAGPSRRVAVFDLAGAFGSEDPDGLTLAFRDGRSLNATARPLEASSREHFLVPRGPGAVDASFGTHERWPRLIDGFRATDSLLVLLVDDPRGPVAARALLLASNELLGGLRERADRSLLLVERDGVASLEPLGAAAPALERAPNRRLATPIASIPAAAVEVASAPAAPAPAMEAERVLPRTTPARAGRVQAAGSPSIARRGVRLAIASFVVAIAAGEWLWAWGAPAADDAPAPYDVVSVGIPVDAGGATTPDTIALPAVVNPGDIGRAALWTVEAVISNDRADATYLLAAFDAMPARTLSPVWLGGDPLPWYKVTVGAFIDRADAVRLRTLIRRAGVLDLDGGVIASAPYALRLGTGLTPAAARTRVNELAAQDIAAYALRDTTGTATIYAGAFASSEDAILLLGELRRKNLDAAFAIRVGRPF